LRNETLKAFLSVQRALAQRALVKRKGPIWAHYFFLLVAASIKMRIGSNTIARSSHIL